MFILILQALYRIYSHVFPALSHTITSRSQQGGEESVYQEDFAKRLAHLRMQRGVSARDMSLSIGQNAGYINNIENGKSLPSMSGFFFICEYLRVSPQEFFDLDSDQPASLRSLIANLKKLDSRQLESISILAEGLVDRK